MTADRALAKTYTHGTTNRRAREGVESKTVFKSVLENPFHIRWPIVPLNVQNAILARVVDLLQGVAEYNIARRKQVRKDKKRQRRDIEATIRDMKKRPSGEQKKMGSMEAIDAMFAAACQKTTPIDNEEADVGMELDEPEPSSTHTDSRTDNRNSSQAAPEAVHCITLGINEVTKRLEHQCRPPSIRITSGPCRDTDPEIPSPHVRIVLACRQDVDPPLLIAHIPQLVAACNARHPNEPVTLVPLPKGSEATLAQALRMRSVSVAALEGSLSDDATLRELFNSVPIIVAPWKVGEIVPPDSITTSAQMQQDQSTTTIPAKKRRTNRIKHISTHIKQLRTTAPKDIRAAKAQRAKMRAEAKLRRRSKQEKGEKANSGGKTVDGENAKQY